MRRIPLLPYLQLALLEDDHHVAMILAFIELPKMTAFSGDSLRIL
jgi:hypothetical protein